MYNKLYIEKLLRPLSEEELLKLFELYKKEMDEIHRTKIIEHNLRLVVLVIKRYENIDCDINDMFAIGTIGLIKAVDKYDKEKGIKFSTFASKCIENEILMFLRKFNKQRYEASLNTTIGENDEGIELTLEEVLFDEGKNIEEDYVKKESIICAIDKLDCLEQLEREFILLFFGFNKYNKRMTQQSIAEMYGISRSYVSRIISRGIKKIRNELDNDVITYENTKKIEKLG